MVSSVSRRSSCEEKQLGQSDLAERSAALEVLVVAELHMHTAGLKAWAAAAGIADSFEAEEEAPAIVAVVASETSS